MVGGDNSLVTGSGTGDNYPDRGDNSLITGGGRGDNYPDKGDNSLARIVSR